MIEDIHITSCKGFQTRFAIMVKIIIDNILQCRHEMGIPWVTQEQTKIKHQLLQNYIDPWMAILLSQQEKMGLPQKLLYFDGFSGPGIYYEDNSRNSTCQGSPLIVAEIANKYLDAKADRKVNIICIDNDKKCVNMLNSKLDEINKQGQYWKAYHAEFDEAVNSLLDDIEKRGLDTPPMFFFIDPFGYSGFPIKTLKRILIYPRAELFINLMIYDIVRFCEEPSFEPKLKGLYGCIKFKKASACKTGEEREIYLTNLYCKQLKEAAGAKYVMPFKVNTPNQGSRPKYYLIHVSNNIKALRVMKDRMAKISELPYSFEAIGISTQLNIFEDPNKVDLRERIINYCLENATRKVDYNELEDWAYVFTNGINKTIKGTLLDLEKNKIVKIERKIRQKKNTVTEGAKIKYLGVNK